MMDSVQKIIDNANKKIDDEGRTKETDVMKV